MNLSCVLVFLLVVNIALGYTICRNWTPWLQDNDETRNVVGGAPIRADGDFPYLVSLQYRNGKHMCGGSILNKRYILTAAHCFDDKNIFPVRIQYGKVKIKKRGHNIVPVKRVIIHENYFRDNYTTQNDIAIVELKADIKFGRHASPVNLPYKNEVVPESNNMVIMGWGQIRDPGSTQTKAFYTIISKFTDAYCSKRGIDVSYQFCGGILKGGRGTCYGDSGGPVVINGKQYGIVSGKTLSACGSPAYPEYYTRVPVFRVWIHRKTGV